MYENPITKIYGQIQNEIIKQDEEHLMCSVNQSVGYQVDKDELLKALRYDREQYQKGYKDCKTEMLDKVKEVKKQIKKYEADCLVLEDRPICYECNETMFKAIYHIFDELIESEVSE